jgi:hypothetical protein
MRFLSFHLLGRLLSTINHQLSTFFTLTQYQFLSSTLPSLCDEMPVRLGPKDGHSSPLTCMLNSGA